MEIILIAMSIFVFLVFLLAMIVFSPVIVSIDSRNRQVRLRWLYVLELHTPLPWVAGEKRLFVFRKPVPLRVRQPSGKPARPAEAAPPSSRKRRALGRFFMRCLADSSIRRTLACQVAKLIRRVRGSVALSRAESSVSLPDPALNGMLAGALAASRWARRSGIRVNFTGENRVFIELRFHPHRVLKAFLFFLPGLPFRAMFRVWRAVPALRP